MTADLERDISSIGTVRTSRAEQRETDRISTKATAVYTASVRVAKLDAVVGPAIQLAVRGSFVVVLLVGGLRVATGTSPVADLMAFLLYMTYLITPIGAVFEAITTTQRGIGALHRINEALALPSETDDEDFATTTRTSAGTTAIANSDPLRFRCLGETDPTTQTHPPHEYGKGSGTSARRPPLQPAHRNPPARVRTTARLEEPPFCHTA